MYKSVFLAGWDASEQTDEPVPPVPPLRPEDFELGEDVTEQFTPTERPAEGTEDVEVEVGKALLESSQQGMLESYQQGISAMWRKDTWESLSPASRQIWVTKGAGILALIQRQRAEAVRVFVLRLNKAEQAAQATVHAIRTAAIEEAPDA